LHERYPNMITIAEGKTRLFFFFFFFLEWCIDFF
jgi:hypothetical protein